MDGAIVYLFIAVLAAFTISFLVVFHLAEGPWLDGVGLAFGGMGCVGLFYLFVLINEGPRYTDKVHHTEAEIRQGAGATPQEAVRARR